jgi:hypothetical protein
MVNSEALKIYASIFALLKNREVNADENFCGFLHLNAKIIADLKTLVEYGMSDTSVDLLKEKRVQAPIDIDELKDEHFIFDCKISLNSHWERGGYYIGPNWNALLKSASRVLNPVRQAFFTDTNELTTNESQHYKNYKSLSKICEFIDEVSLPVDNDSSARTIIFERDISLYYSLKECDLEHALSIEAIERLLHKDLHHEAKVSLVRGELVKFLKDKGTNQRFGYLVSNFNAFSSELLLSYQAYVEQYTFDKVRKEYQEKKTDYIQRVNNTYSDIGAKVLAIPAGLWLAVFKIEETSIGTFSFLKNVIILFLCILCMCYAIFHFSAQFSVLKSLKEEYKSLFERLALEHTDESAKIREARKLIDNQAEWTWLKLCLSNFATFAIFILVLILSFFSVG